MLQRDTNNSKSFHDDENTTFHLLKFDNFTAQNTSTVSSAPAVKQSDDWTAQLYYAIANYMYIIGNPLLTVVGSANNLLTLVVMSRKSFRSTSVAVYLSAAAISDTLTLIMDFLNNWMSSVSRVNLLGISDAFCKFHRFFLSLVFTYSAWIVTTMCVERFIVVWFPFKAKAICNHRTALVTVLTLPIPDSAVQIYRHFAWYADGTNCVMKEGGWTYFQSEWGPWITGLTYSYLPSIVMLMLNALIVGKLTLASRMRRQMAMEATTIETKELRVTVTIVIISVLYVTMTTPLVIYYTVAYHLNQFTSYNPQFAVVRTMVILVASSSYAANFFLYVLNSSAFRKELKTLLCGCYLRPRGSKGTADVSSYATDMSTVTADGGGGGVKVEAGRKNGNVVPKTEFSVIANGEGQPQIAPEAVNCSSASDFMTF